MVSENQYGEAPVSSLSRLSEFISLPLTISLPSTKSAQSIPNPTHYIYIRAHEPRGDEVLNKPALFISNLPIDATESAVKSLFNTLCAGRGRVQKTVLQSASKSINGFGSIRDNVIEESGTYEDDNESDNVDSNVVAGMKRHIGLVDNSISTVAAGAPKGKKIKRIVVSARVEEQKLLDQLEATPLPSVWEGLSRPLPSGSCAVVYFVDKASVQSCLKACQKVAKKVTKGDHSARAVWDTPSDFITGRARYSSHHRLLFPSPQNIRPSINAYLGTFAVLEKHRQAIQEQLANEPDEDGFITVTKATRTGVTSAEAEAAQQRQAQRKEKSKVGNTFYRFQVREQMREQDRQLREGFEEDVKRLREVQALKRG